MNLTDDQVKKIVYDHEAKAPDQTVLEGKILDDVPPSTPQSTGPSSPERELRSRIESGEWDNLDDLEAFRIRTPEGQLMCRTEAIDFRIHQLEGKLPMLLNQYLHDAYIQILKKIYALRKTKAGLFYSFYKSSGQRDLNSPN
mgnify:FL=1